MTSPLLPLSAVLPLMRCPRCRSAIETAADSIYCTGRGCTYASGFDRVDGLPVLVDFENSVLVRDTTNETKAASPIQRSQLSSVTRRIISLLFAPSPQAIKNTRRFLSELSHRRTPATVLVIGGGTLGAGGTKLLYDSPNIRLIAFDIYASPLTQFVADAHQIPLADGCIDGVLIQAVLEHVLDPWRVAAEIHRVLAPNGVVYAETPFLQHVHEGPYDFTRFTDSGHRWLFRNFDCVDSGSVIGVGTQLQWALAYAVRSLARSHKAGKLTSIALFWLRYLDRLAPSEYNVDAASAVYFIGVRSHRAISPKQAVTHYRGAMRGRR